MKRITIRINDRGIDWQAKKRIILRTSEGIVLGTVKSKNSGTLRVTLDSGIKMDVSVKSPSILGEGLNRKRKTIIPDDELYAWKRELCAEHLGR